jgi:hypothetical protein
MHLRNVGQNHSHAVTRAKSNNKYDRWTYIHHKINGAMPFDVVYLNCTWSVLLKASVMKMLSLERRDPPRPGF